MLRRLAAVAIVSATLAVGAPLAAAGAVDNPADQAAPSPEQAAAGVVPEEAGTAVEAAAEITAETTSRVAALLAAITATAKLPEERMRELAYAVGIDVADDRRGIMDSLYRGEWYMPKRDDVRKCIARRESHGNYRAVSAGGDFRGAYQMSEALGVGATWMMQPEVRKEMGDRGVDIVQKLRKTPVQKWNRYWQDRAFWTIWAKGEGRSHWGGCKSN